MEKYFYIVAGALFLGLLALYVDLLKLDKLGSAGFSTLVVSSFVLCIVVAKLPDVYEVNIGGNTVKALKKENDRAEEILPKLERLRVETFIMQLNGVANSSNLSRSYYQTGTTKAEEFDLFISIFELLPREDLNGKLLKSTKEACQAIMLRQHLLLGEYFMFSDEEVKPGMLSRVGTLDKHDYRAMPSDEIQSEVDRLHQQIQDNPDQSLDNDKNIEYRLDAAKNYKEISDLYFTLIDREEIT